MGIQNLSGHHRGGRIVAVTHDLFDVPILMHGVTVFIGIQYHS